MRQFLHYTADLIVRPRAALRALLDDPRRVGFGYLGLLALAVVYFAGISAAIALDAPHTPQMPVLNLPPEDYYAYERFYIFPMGLAGVILAAGLIRLVARSWNGKGQFEDLFALLGFSIIIVALVMGVSDLVLNLLVGSRIMSTPNLFWDGHNTRGPHIWLGTLWYLLLTLLAVREAERLGWGKSAALAVIGFAANGAVQFVFMR